MSLNSSSDLRLAPVNCGVFQAMVDVVVHQSLLGLSDRLFNGMKLLSDVEARPPLL
jgi:hypothetical protein